MNKDLVFIASGGRTGTQFFGHRLKDVVEDCWSEHEPDMIAGFSSLSASRIRRFGLRHMIIDRLVGATGIRVIGHQLLSGAITRYEAAKRLRKARKRYHNGIPQSLIVESYFRWWMCASVINDAWPEARMVAIIRDPRTWISSWLRHSPDLHRKGWLHWFPLGALKPGDVGDTAWASEWENFDSFGRLAWDWRMTYGHLHKVASENSHIKIFRFEDIFGGSDTELRKFLKFITDFSDHAYATTLDKGFTSSVFNASSGGSKSWESWSDEDAQLLEQLCGDLMRSYGYGQEPNWIDKLSFND